MQPDDSAVSPPRLPRAVSAEDLRKTTEVLEALIADRGLLARLPEPERVTLLMAAGRVSHPVRHETTRLSKTCRRQKAKEKRHRDRETRKGAGIRAAREEAVFVAPPRIEAADAAGDVLEKPQICYVCKAEFTKLHFFYDTMCPACADLNYEKRFQTASLAGRVALITGARVKIGFQAALKMLRAGARVIVTTRFPNDAAQRFAREPDNHDWADRLQVYGLDLRHSPSVEIFARYLDLTLDRLDIVINNACQTVRRPPQFYAHLMALETTPTAELPADVRRFLRDHAACREALTRKSPALEQRLPVRHDFVQWNDGAPGIGLRAPAQLSQIPAAEDATLGLSLFPRGSTDADLQQVDLRKTNSWRLTLAEVPSPEMLEVQLVNAVAPFILCARLKPLMLRDRTDEKHIVNVSAMEGKFTRGTKTDKHPHTNMAKASLNMMTLTSAPDYAKDGIFMNAVDTGWVTDEDPAIHATRKRVDLDFQPPLDIVDGAARICDPFFSGLLTGVHVHGKFLKDYAPTEW
jgi:NAD(P)-dependent dehydrogenase (short-subunit alcohol dehydrogenase family)